MAKNEFEFGYFDGIGNSTNSHTIPIQALPQNQKTKSWKRATIDALEREGVRQLHKNVKFREYRKMIEGEFTYTGVGMGDFQDMDMPWFDKEVRNLRQTRGIPTYLKHFDFLGMMVNALSSVYQDLDDRFRVESIDEYSTNEYIRQKTEMMHSFAQQRFVSEINKMLTLRGFDPNREDFESEEEYNQYQQEVQQQVQSLTPPEIEKFMSKNFKVLATEWAQNVLTEDKKRFYLKDQELEEFIDYILTGRFFRHYRVGFDSYTIERWRPEETFFSQDLNAKYPQEGEFVGRITTMAVNELLNTYGHLMTVKQQERVGNYWNQTKKWDTITGLSSTVEGGKRLDQKIFPKPTITPFHNYFDHEINLQMEDALGVPLGVTTTKDGEGNDVSFSTWLPRMEEDNVDFNTNLYSRYLRDDIEVRRDAVRVTEVYWMSQKRIGILIYENNLGTLSIEITTDDLMPEFLEKYNISTTSTVSLQELQTAMRNQTLDEYVNKIAYFYVPEAWHGIKIRGNGSTIKEDIYLDVKPLDYQIKYGDSKIYDVALPVTGYIGVGIAQKIMPYQQLHNICMNQITELLEKELGVFFTFDITGLPSEYQDESTEESILRVRDLIKDTGFFGLDLSRQNTAGNQPNVFQRQEIVYATQVEYRWALAEKYKREAFGIIGINDNILGAPTTYETAEGVKQGSRASYALLNNYFDKFNTAKAKGMEVHLAIAQYCQVNGKDSTVLIRKSDGDHMFLDIIAEDGEIFPLRHLGVVPETDSTDRKVVEQIKEFLVNDNTLDRDISTIIEILKNPVLTEITQIAEKSRKDKEAKVQEERAFQQEQLDKQLQANSDEMNRERAHEKEITQMKIDGDIREKYIDALGRASDKDGTVEDYDRIEKATQNMLAQQNKEVELGMKQQEYGRKQEADISKTKLELRKLGLEAEKIRLQKEKMQSAERIALYNKN